MARETELPGVGTKHTLDLASGEELVVVEHRAGHFEIARVDAEGNTTTLIQLPSRDAAELGRILSRAGVREKDRRQRMLLEEFGIEWVKVAESSPLIGQTLREAQIRERTGVSVIALLRTEGAIQSPPPDTRFENGDTLVVIGTRDQVEDFLATYSMLPSEA